MNRDRRQQGNVDERSTSFLDRIRERFKLVRENISPSSRAWRGAAIALLLASFLIWLWATLPQIVLASLSSSLLIAGADLVVAPIAAGFLLVILSGLTVLPRFFRWVLVTVVVLLITLGSGPSQRGWLLTVAVLVLTISIVGGVLWSLVGGGWSRMRWSSRLLTLIALALSLVVLVGGASWVLGAGTPARQIPNAAKRGTPTRPSREPDPSQPGTFPVQKLIYGSGKDIQRPEYGADVAITTASVDASRIVQGWSGWTGAARTRFWGFDEKALPINGRVWYPEGNGPFPLVLIVHGNSRA